MNETPDTIAAFFRRSPGYFDLLVDAHEAMARLLRAFAVPTLQDRPTIDQWSPMVADVAIPIYRYIVESRQGIRFGTYGKPSTALGIFCRASAKLGTAIDFTVSTGGTPSKYISEIIYVLGDAYFNTGRTLGEAIDARMAEYREAAYEDATRESV